MMVVEPSRGILVVADGMGGAPGGDIASSLAVQEVARSLYAGAGMEEAILSANEKILEMVSAQPGLSGMGTTLTALKIVPETHTFSLGHVGDSRAYRFSKDVLLQISTDHTMVQDMVTAGKIPVSAARDHPFAHLLSRALGTDPDLVIDVEEGPVHEGDYFLLCSDGLMKVFDDEEIEERMRALGSKPLEEVVNSLVEEANERGAPDNVTVAILGACPDGPAPPL
jgi:protein phosphatase